MVLSFQNLAEHVILAYERSVISSSYLLSIHLTNVYLSLRLWLESFEQELVFDRMRHFTLTKCFLEIKTALWYICDNSIIWSDWEFVCWFSLMVAYFLAYFEFWIVNSCFAGFHLWNSSVVSGEQYCIWVSQCFQPEMLISYLGRGEGLLNHTDSINVNP